METQEEEIIFGALNLFGKYGIRSVTMDDVAREMSISKKTIYRHFENKADLVHKCVMTVYNAIKDSLEVIHKETNNPIDELFAIDKVVREILERHNPGHRFQLKKYYPKTFKAMYDGRKALINRMIAENIENGKKSGFYRGDFNTDLITHLYCSKVETMPDEEEDLANKYNMHELMHQALIYHIRAIASSKGLEYLDEKLKTEKQP